MQPQPQPARPNSATVKRGAHFGLGADHPDLYLRPGHRGVEQLPGKHSRILWRHQHRDFVGLAALAFVNRHGVHGLDFRQAAGREVELPAGAGETSEGRTPADNATVRTVFVVGPDKKIKLQLSYPMTTGRNFDEILRIVDSLQLTAKHKVATPANWKQGDDVIIAGSVTDDAARQAYPEGWKAPRRYIRIVPQPRG